MWKAYTGAGEIAAQNLYCAASGALLKVMAARGVVDCIYRRFWAGSPDGHNEWRAGDAVTSSYEFSTANEQQVFHVCVGHNQLIECNRPAPFGWRAYEFRKSRSFTKLIAEAHLLDDNTMYYFAKE